MSNSLTGRKRKDTYTWLMQMQGNGTTLDAVTPVTMCFGDGTETPVSMTTTGLYIGGSRAITEIIGDGRYSRVLYSSGVKVARSATVGNFTLASITIPANSIGPNGWLEVRFLITGLNTATVGTRYNTISLGSGTLKQHTPTASVNYNIAQDVVLHARNSNASQIMTARNDRADFVWGQHAGVGAGGDAAGLATSIDLSVSQTLTVVSTSVDASDTAFLQMLQVIAHYAP